MQEVAFHKKNREKWKRFEELLADRRRTDPDTLASLFVELTDDLAYARTFYPTSSTTQYLNSITAKVHQAIYRNKKEERSRFLTFWTQELPRLAYTIRRDILYTFLLFALFFVIGWISAANDATYVRLIMGDSYVNMTLQNMEKGDPMAVYKQMHGTDMFAYITVNNIQVSLFAFAFGVLLPPFGTLYIMLRNGVMIGSFMCFFHQRGFLTQALLAVWLHGTLEISAIILAGAAGMVMGKSIIFPGTFTRTQSFLRGAKNGLKLVIGLVPIFVTAGFIESYLTRHTDMPILLNLAIIVGSLAFILWYFVLYPYSLHKRDSHATTTGLQLAAHTRL